MRAITMCVIFAGSLSAQALGWSTYSNTKLGDVCPANRGTGLGTDYANYPFFDKCSTGQGGRGYFLDDWGSCAVDTAANSLLCWGGGHSDYWGNEVYELTLSGTPAITRIIGPDSWTGSSITGGTVTNGNPAARHTFGCFEYVPNVNAVINLGGTLPNGNSDNVLWMLERSDNTWHNKGTATWSVANDGSWCVYDASRQVPGVSETVIISNGGGSRYIVLATILLSDHSVTFNKVGMFNGGSLTCTAIQMVHATSRDRLYYFGDKYPSNGGTCTQYISMSDPNTIVDITSTVTGAPTFTDYPGAEWDSYRNTAVIYNNSGNSVYEFNPGTGAYSTITYTGGPTTVPSTGTMGHFRYLANVNYYVLINNANANVSTLRITGIPPVITNPASAGAITAGTQNTAYTYTFAASGTTPLTWSITSGSPPTGVSINSSTGVLAGTPTAYGTFNFTVSVTNGYGSPSAYAVSLTIAPVCLITSATMPSGKFNQPYSQTVPTAGCTSPTFARTAGTLPTGLTLHTSTGVIDGTPTASGLFSFTIGVTDAAGNPSQATGITIIPGPGVFNVLSVPGLVYR